MVTDLTCVCRPDIIPVSHNPTLLKAEKAALCERFEMTDLGLINRNRESRTLTINQTNSTWTKFSRNLEWKTANLFLLHLNLVENSSILHHVPWEAFRYSDQPTGNWISDLHVNGDKTRYCCRCWCPITVCVKAKKGSLDARQWNHWMDV